MTAVVRPGGGPQQALGEARKQQADRGKGDDLADAMAGRANSELEALGQAASKRQVTDPKGAEAIAAKAVAAESIAAESIAAEALAAEALAAEASDARFAGEPMALEPWYYGRSAFYVVNGTVWGRARYDSEPVRVAF